MFNLASRRKRALFAATGILALAVAGAAEARPGGGSSSGSRGSRTYDAPAATRTAPNTAEPIQRTQTPQPLPQRPGQPAQTAPAGGGFGRGLAGGLMGGLLGAGLVGLLFGSGLAGGLGGIASFIGLLLQLALLAGLVMLALRFFRRRQEPALAGPNSMARTGLGVPGQQGGVAFGGGGRPAPAAPRGEPITIGPNDYTAFERLLAEVNQAYSRQDVPALWNLATPEMAGYLQEELNENVGKGVVNTTSNVRLLQGDLAEAWREGPVEYATVAMRFQLVDVTVERATGRVVAGDPNRPVESTEVWTFRRDQGGPWKLSAIQQTR